MTFGRVAVLVGVAVLVLVANVAASIGYMVLYSYAIDPGHEAKYYNDHIQVAGPYCSIVAGIPLMFAAVAGFRTRLFLLCSCPAWRVLLSRHTIGTPG
ncbi:MAG TPA: hypothetical protein VFV34_24460 [Blastocatellia bacterium]|nr:hypothetical protein [Blastocatellia bacterium]